MIASQHAIAARHRVTGAFSRNCNRARNDSRHKVLTSHSGGEHRVVLHRAMFQRVKQGVNDNGPDVFQVSTGGAEPVSVHHGTAAVSVRRRQASQIPSRDDVRESRTVLADRRSRHARTDPGRAADDRPLFTDRGLHPGRRNGLRLLHRPFPQRLLSAAQQRQSCNRALLCLPVSRDLGPARSASMPQWASGSAPSPRHCERSEAIHLSAYAERWIASAFAKATADKSSLRSSQ